jgi:hypothetical protein
MIPHLVYYQLVILVLLGLCVMLPYLWPSPGAGSHPKRAEPTPLKAKRKPSNDPKPFAGLTQKPHCALCERDLAFPQTPPPVHPTLCPRRTGVPVKSTPRNTSFRMRAAPTEGGWIWVICVPTVIPVAAPGVSSTARRAAVTF